MPITLPDRGALRARVLARHAGLYPHTRSESTMEKKARLSLIYVIIALFGVMILHDAWVSYHKVAALPYSDFQTLLNEDKIKEVVITDREIRGELKAPTTGGKSSF